MTSTEDVLKWATEIAETLKLDMQWTQSEYSTTGGYWGAIDNEAEARIRSRATAALSFLDRFAGSSSRWATEGHQLYANNSHSMETGARQLGDMLIEWRRQVELGHERPLRIESMGARAVASTDLMEQVHALNDDDSMSPAAPIVLAGAALEIALRSAVEELSLDVVGRPGIDSYATALRKVELLSKQDKKDVDQMAGLRNQAAHGEHDTLSRERAGLMEQQVNMFLRILDSVLEERL